MTHYIAIYNGSHANQVIKDTLTKLDVGRNIILIDTLLDEQCLELSKELQSMRYKCTITECVSEDVNELSYKISAVCTETMVKVWQSGEEQNKFYMEVGTLNGPMAGAVYTAAFREGGTVVYIDDNGDLKEVEYQKAPDVERVNYMPRRALDILYENGKLKIEDIERILYADQILNKTEEEILEFFRQHHNAYKVMERLRDKKWVRYNKNSKYYENTELGNTARALLDLKDEKEKKYPRKPRKKAEETVF